MRRPGLQEERCEVHLRHRRTSSVNFGGHIFARKICIKCPNFTWSWFLPEKLSKYRNLYDICPKNLQNSRILHNNCPRNIFSRILGGGGHVPPAPRLLRLRSQRVMLMRRCWFQRSVVQTWFLRVMRGWSAVITWQQLAVTWLVRRGYSPVIRPVDGPEPSATALNVRYHCWAWLSFCRCLWFFNTRLQLTTTYFRIC